MNFPSIKSRRRLIVLAVILLVALPGVTIHRLVEIQFLHATELSERGENQRFQSNDIRARRGDILDSNRELLATSLTQYTIWADPRLVSDVPDTARQLSEILEIAQDQLEERLASTGAFVYLSRKVSEEKQLAVAALGLSGVGSYKEYARHYPMGRESASALVGFVGSEEQGLSGIEFSYNDLLIGKPGRIYLEGDISGNPIATGVHHEQPAQAGNSVQLSIDRHFQFITEQILLQHTSATNSLSGTALVMHPSTGRILAMATVKQSAEGGYELSQANRAVTWAYEPGSAIKALTFSAVLEENIAQPGTERVVPAELEIYDSLFEDHDWHPPVNMDVSEIMRISSNVGTILWGTELGRQRHYDYLRSFGLGDALLAGEIPGETPGLITEPQRWSGTSSATISLGQGVALTPLQLLNAYNVIANDGVWVQPQLVTDVTSPDGRHIGPEITPNHRVISPNTATQMREILELVVAEGTGQSADLQDYKVAGKTGTARKPLPNGGYEDEEGNYRYITTFAGFLPSDEPVVSLLVVLEEPSNSIYASQTAAPAFRELASEAVKHFSIPPQD